jgi:molybdopterin/thiamine biosynthesis adenylyltransferase
MQLARFGVGRIRLIDFDIVQEHNLSDQSLYTLRDAQNCASKASAAVEHIRNIDAEIVCEPVETILVHSNAIELTEEMDVIIDAVDSFETKYLLNDVSISNDIPLIYGGCAGSKGTVLSIIPGRSSCLRCIWPTPPLSGSFTCSSVGLLPATSAITGAVQAAEAIKILLGRFHDVNRCPILLDSWHQSIRSLSIESGPRPECPTCSLRDFAFLENRSPSFEDPSPGSYLSWGCWM